MGFQAMITLIFFGGGQTYANIDYVICACSPIPILAIWPLYVNCRNSHNDRKIRSELPETQNDSEYSGLKVRQAGAELGQAQLKLELELSLTFAKLNSNFNSTTTSSYT